MRWSERDVALMRASVQSLEDALENARTELLVAEQRLRGGRS